jgi:hypothetical protein
MPKKLWLKFFKDKKELFYATVNIILILLALNLLAGNLGLFDQFFMRLAATCVLLAAILLNLPVRKTVMLLLKKSKNIIVGIFLVIVSFIVLFASETHVLWLASIPMLIVGLEFMLRGLNIKRKELSLLLATSFLYALFIVFVENMPLLWYAIQRFSILFSQGTSTLIGKNFIFGPSASGLWILFPLIIFSVVLFIFSERNKKRLILSIVGLIAAWFTYLVIRAFYSFETNVDAINSKYLLFILFLIPVLLYFLKTKTSELRDLFPVCDNRNLKQLLRKGGVIVIVLLFISVVVLTVFPYADAKRGKVVFYRENMLGDWNKPEYGRYGRDAYGMFGLLPDHLEAAGYSNMVLNDSVTKEALDGASIFVVINLVNLNESFTSIEHSLIWDFVDNGGSRLVLGDHTDIGGIMNPLNSLLDPVGIRFRFDSALPLGERWQNGIQILHHPLDNGIKNENQIDISVGASLDINWRPSLTSQAFPLVIGKHGFSDHGDYLNTQRAFLGDYKLNHGEQLCDIILAAGAFYGNGKVLVFGDTSSFQNPALPYSSSFVLNVFGWLSSGRTYVIKYAQVALSLILLTSAALLVIFRFNTKNYGFLSILLPFVLCAGLLTASVVNPLFIDKQPLSDSLILIDASHGERFSLDSYTNDATTGLMVNFARNNYSFLILRSFSKEQIRMGKALVLIAPTKPFAGDEMVFLKSFMSDGGLIILSTGFEDKEASQPLLNELGFSIENIPLGPVPYVEEAPEEYQNEPRFVDSWPIIINDNTETTVFYNVTIENTTYDIMVFKKYGSGGFLLISDSKFLLDKNIESLYDYWPGNILFLKNIIDELQNMEVLT